MNAVETGTRLASLRRILGYTPDSFAALLGMSRRAYLAYERGQRTQSAAWLRVGRAAHDATGVSFDWLFVGPPDPMFRPGCARGPTLRLVVGTA